MPNIMLKKSSISAISRQIERMQTETEDAEKKIRSALNGLDFEVASKQNIRNCLNNLITSANRQGSLSGQYKSAFLNVTNSVAEGDSRYGNRSQSIIDRIKRSLRADGKSIGDFLFHNKIRKIMALTGVFIVSPICVITAVDVKLLEKMASISKNWFGTTAHAAENEPVVIGVDPTNAKNDNRTAESNNGFANADTNSAPAEPIQNENVQTNGNIKGYAGSSRDVSGGAYGDYSVVSGFDEKYVLNQYDYDLRQSDGSNGGCTSTSDAMVGAFKNNQYYNPEDDWPGPGHGGARWTHTKSIEGSSAWSASRRYTEIYNQINSGNAVVIRVTGHSMVAVGVKNGCDPNNMSAADVLIANPGTGKISNLQEYLTSSRRELDNSWSLRVAK